MEVFTSTLLCVIRHRFMCRCYHEAVNEKTNTSVKVIFCLTDVSDQQFETITNQGLKCPSLPGLTHWVNPGLPGLGFKPYFGKVGNTGE